MASAVPGPVPELGGTAPDLGAVSDAADPGTGPGSGGPATSPGGLATSPGGPGGLPAELTTGQAADLLGVSRATVVHLVERGDLPALGTGARRRLATADVVACLRRARERRTASLDEVIAASRDLGLYG